MPTQFFANPEDGRVEGFADGARPPQGWAPVPEPEHGLDKWDFDSNSYVAYEEPVDVRRLITEAFSNIVLQNKDNPELSDPILGAILVKGKEIEGALDIGLPPARIVKLMEGIVLPPSLAAQRDALVAQYKQLVGM